MVKEIGSESELLDGLGHGNTVSNVDAQIIDYQVVVHFIEADCRTTIGRQTRYFHFATEEGFRSFVSRCNLEDLDKFNRSMAQWSYGSSHANLTEEQYRKLKG